MKVASSFSRAHKRSRVLGSGLKELNLTWLVGKSAARRAVLLKGIAIADDENDPLSRDSTWLRPSRWMTGSGTLGGSGSDVTDVTMNAILVDCSVLSHCESGLGLYSKVFVCKDVLRDLNK